MIKFYTILRLLSQTFLGILKIVFLSKSGLKIKQTQHCNNNLILLGNGPSLTDYITNNRDKIAESHNLALNHFATTNYFEEIKPEYYVAIAHDLFLDDVMPEHIQASNKLFETMASKTTWKMIFFVPYFAKKQSRWQKILQSNTNITVRYFNETPVEGFEGFCNLAYSKNWGMPRPHNVMIPSISISILLNYRNIIITGADHSWLKDIFVNENNETMFVNKHFYDKKVDAQRFYQLGKRPMKLHEFLESLASAFASYHSLKRWADTKQIKILNTTQGSYIDAFDRLTEYDGKI